MSKVIDLTGLSEFLKKCKETFAPIAKGVQFMGIAHPSTNPGTPKFPQFYIAYEEGNYPYFDASLDAHEVAMFVSNVSNEWDVIDILEPPYTATITYDAFSGTVQNPYILDAATFEAVVDSFVSGSPTMIIFEDTEQNYISSVIAMKVGFIICTLVDGDDVIKTVYIQSES